MEIWLAKEILFFYLDLKLNPPIGADRIIWPITWHSKKFRNFMKILRSINMEIAGNYNPIISEFHLFSWPVRVKFWKFRENYSVFFKWHHDTWHILLNIFSSKPIGHLWNHENHRIFEIFKNFRGHLRKFWTTNLRKTKILLRPLCLTLCQSILCRVLWQYCHKNVTFIIIIYPLSLNTQKIYSCVSCMWQISILSSFCLNGLKWPSSDNSN